MTGPALHWREPGDVRVVLDVPAAGVFVGVDARSAPVLLPAVGPRATRIGVVGDWRIAALLAFRLLGVGCLLTLATDEPGRWRHLLDAAGPRGTTARNAVGWPPRAGGGPHLLVTDRAAPPTPPPGSPCTVVHVVERVPTGGPYWPAVDAVLVAGRGHGAALAGLLGRDDAHVLDTIGPAQLGLLDRVRAVAVTVVLADPERSLLLGR